jgi:2-oxoisovalerate dehydrogenase E1 component alpha subunit
MLKVIAAQDLPGRAPHGECGAAPLRIQIPQPAVRPGQAPDFSRLKLPSTPLSRPHVTATPDGFSDHANGLVRVLTDEHEAKGAWAPQIELATLRRGLRAMLLTRIYDEHMVRAQRQGKTSFYVKSRGEEAVSVAQALALDPADMFFPHYRIQGALIARGYPLAAMMSQVFSNSADPLKGRQMPCLYASRDFNYFSHSANLGTQFSQAVGWAMAAGLKGDTRIASTWIGEGATAEGDFHYALTFASVYKVPVILNIINNQWAISSFSGIAGGERATFAARGLGYGLPAIRVDGNDFLAVYAVTQWAAERARSNAGATVIELVTYRADAHSTSDDPSRYRPVEEAQAWPLGDPIERLKGHLIRRGEWSDDQHAALETELTAEVKAIQRETEQVGTLHSGDKVDPSTLFEGVYKDMDWRLRQQAEQAGTP